jgi:hypothetical protein
MPNDDELAPMNDLVVESSAASTRNVPVELGELRTTDLLIDAKFEVRKARTLNG